MDRNQSQHLTEEELILSFYGEETGRAGTAEHLASCELCRTEYETLDRMLSAVGSAPVPWRPPAYGGEVWRQMKHRLPQREARSWSGFFQLRRWQFPGLGWSTALALLVIGAFLVGRLSPRQSDSPEARAVAPANLDLAGAGLSGGPERVWLNEMGRHLERSQLALVELLHSKTNGVVDIALEQILAQELVSVNRLYRNAARTADDKPLNNLLEDLELILVEVANAPPQLSREEFAGLRQRIDTDGLLFKVKVLASALRDREQKSDRRRLRS